MKLILILLFAFSAYAEESAKVVLLRGEAKFRGQYIKMDQILFGKGEFEIADKSYLKLLLQKSKTVIALGSNTVTNVDFGQENMEPELQLFKGTARWLTGAGKKREGGGVRTKNATMGIRGTDFWASYNPVFNESEIICFDGRIQLSQIAEPSDIKMVSKNQWGGIGGRFGKKIGEIINLSPEIIESMKREMPIE